MRLYHCCFVVLFGLFGAGGPAWAATHTITSSTQMDAAFWADLTDGDIVVLSGDFAVPADPVLSNKSVTITADGGATRALTLGSHRPIWANAAAGQINTLTLDGIVLTGGAGNSVGGALRGNLGYAPIDVRPELKVVFKNNSEVSGNRVTGLNSVFDSGDMFDNMLAPSFQAVGGGFMLHSASLEGDSITFRDNRAVAIGQDDPSAMMGTMFAGAGGGVMAMNVLNMRADHIIFNGNQARDESDDGFYEGGSGGGLWASYPTLTAQNITFENNLAYTVHGGSDGDVDEGGLGGGFYAGVMNMSADHIIFRNNRAQGEGDHTGYGGAMYGTQAINLDGHVLLDGNQAIGTVYSSGKGGAIYSNGTLSLTGSALIQNNLARGDGGHSGLGGAIISRSFTIENAMFLNNQAIGDGDPATYSGLGGAIYFHTQGYRHTGRPDDTANIGTLIAGTGLETSFRGNTDGGATQRRANALFMGTYETSSNPSAIMSLQTGTLNLRAAQGGRISFHDPLASDRRAHQINVNSEAADQGEVRFWGDNEFYGHTTIHRGTFSLMADEGLGSTIYGRQGAGQNSIFNLKGAATLGLDIHAKLLADTFISENGAGLKVGGVSALPLGTSVFNSRIQTTQGVTLGAPLAANTANYDAALQVNGLNADLVVNLRTPSVLGGRHFQALEAFRLSTLPEVTQRAWLERLFNGDVRDTEALATARALEGGSVANSVGALTWAGGSLNSFIDTRAGLFNETDREAPAAGESGDSGRLWVNYAYHQVKQDDRHLVSGYDFTPSAVALGYEYSVSNDILLGLAAQYAGGTVKSNDRYEELDVDSLVGGLYVVYDPGDWYGRANILFGRSDNDLTTRYQAWGQNADASHQAVLFSANAEAGYTFRFGDNGSTRVRPHVGFNYAFARSKAFTETSNNGAPIRHFDKTTLETIEVPVGLFLSREIRTEGGTRITPNLDLAYAHNFGDDNGRGAAAFTGLPDAAWSVVGPEAGRDALKIKAGVDAALSEQVTINFSYQGEFRSKYRDNAGLVGLAVAF